MSMTHVDDYLDGLGADPIAKAFLEHARRPAIDRDYKWLEANAPTVLYKGNDWKCVGASRLGDVWLRPIEQVGAQPFYTLRVAIDSLSHWRTPPQSHGEKQT